MTSINCSFSQVSGFNGGWIPHYELTSSLETTSTYINGKINTAEWQFAVIPVTVPAITGDTKNKYFTFKLNIHMKSSGKTSGTIYYAFSSKGRPDADPHYGEAYGKSNMGTIYVEGSKEISGIHGNDQNFDFTTANFNGLTNSKQTIYLWIWSSGIGVNNTGIGYTLGKKRTGFYSITLNYQEATKVTNPTNFTISKSISKPGENITISWSGAKAGTSNAIKGYQIYWSDNAQPTAASEYIDVKATETSYQYTASSERGITRYFKIQTLGTVSGFDAGLSSSSVSVKTNSKPSAPTIAANKTKLPSTGGTVIFTCTAGSANDSTQTGKVYWGTTNSSKDSIILNDKTLTAKLFSSGDNRTEVTYYFWTFDGLEFNTTPKAITITKNVAPIIQSILLSGQQYSSSLLQEDNGKYILKPTVKCATNNKTGTFTYEFYKEGSITPFYKKTSTSSSYTLETDARTLMQPSTEENVRYHCKVTLNDGIENSNTKESEFLQIPKLPSFMAIYNSFNFETKGTNKNLFADKLSVTIDSYDSGIEIEPILSYSNDTTSKVSIESKKITTDTGNGYNLIIKDILPNRICKISFNFKNKLDINKKILKTQAFENLKSISAIPLENFTGINQDGVYHKIYTSTIEPSFSCTFFDIDEYALLKTYVYFLYNGKKGQDIEVKLVKNETDTVYYFSIPFTTLYNNLPDNVDKNSTKALNIPLYLKATNIFEQSFTSSLPYDFGIDFRENVIYESNKNILSINDEEFSNFEFLKQGMPIFFKGEIKSYNDKPIGQIQIDRKDGLGFINYGDTFEFEKSSGENEVLKPMNPLVYSIEKILINEIGKIVREQYNADFILKIINKSGVETIINLYSGIKVLGHAEPIINLTQALFDGKNLKFVLNDENVSLGIDQTILFNSDNNESSSIGAFNMSKRAPSQSEWESIYSQGLELKDNKIIYPSQVNSIDWPPVAYLRISLQTNHIYKGYSTSYTGFSNEILVYNVLPTTSYRANHLGINYRPETSNINNLDGILYISEYNLYKKVYFIGLNSNGDEEIRSINLKDGALDNFIIDGGTWDS